MGSEGSIDVTVTARAHRFDRGRGAEQRHGMDRLETWENPHASTRRTPERRAAGQP